MEQDGSRPGPRVKIYATRQLGTIQPGDDLALRVVEAFRKDAIEFKSSDILIVAQKIVSKAEGRYVELESVVPSVRAQELAQICQKDARLIELVLRESREVLRCRSGVIIVENHHGVVLANAGVLI